MNKDLSWALLTRHRQLHRVDLVANVDLGSPLVQQRVQAFAAAFAGRGFDPEAARQAAYSVLDQQVTQQASMLSYNDAWILLLTTMLLVSPAILLLRRAQGRAAPVYAH